MANAAPVMKAASLLSRNATNAAISSGLATRPAGFMPATSSSPSAGAPSRPRNSGVSTLPVTSAFTRTPWPAHSSAAARVRPTTPCLAATYAAMPGTPTTPASAALLTIAPPPDASIAGTWYLRL